MDRKLEISVFDERINHIWYPLSLSLVSNRRINLANVGDKRRRGTGGEEWSEKWREEEMGRFCAKRLEKEVLREEEEARDFPPNRSV